MPTEKIDYATIVADMKAKRSALDLSITALETAMAAGALGQGMEVLNSGGQPTATGQPMELPVGAFLQKSIPEAVRLYLTAMRQRKTTKEIVTALQGGGMVSMSDNFESVVNACLQRLKSSQEVLKFSDGWGLAEWYPPSFRPSAEKASTSQKKKAKAPPKAKKSTRKDERFTTPKKTVDPADKPFDQAPSEKPKSSNQPLVEAYFNAHPGEEFSVQEIGAALNIPVQKVALICGSLARWQKLKNTSEGKFCSVRVQAMPKAS